MNKEKEKVKPKICRECANFKSIETDINCHNIDELYEEQCAGICEPSGIKVHETDEACCWGIKK